MTIVQRSLHINATPEQIDSIASDPTRWPEWYANIEAAEVDSIFPEVGGKVDITFNVIGIVFNVKFVQSEFIPAQKSVCRIEGRFTGASRFLLTSEETGTRAELALKYKVPGGFLTGLANDYFIKERIEENLETSLTNLKKLVESEIVNQPNNN